MAKAQDEFSLQAAHQSDDLAMRLQFAEIDAETCQVLVANAPAITPLLPPILNEFYTHLQAFPAVAGLVSNPMIRDHAKEMQLRHWKIILQGKFNRDYAISVAKIGEAHNWLGLAPRWYIGSYSFILSRLIAALQADVPQKGFGRAARERRAAISAALTKVVLLDIELAISTYFEAGARDKRQMLDQLAETFENEVIEVVQTVATAAVRLGENASTMTVTAEETSCQSDTAAKASEMVTANVARVAASTDELSLSILEIGQQIMSVTNAMSNAAAQARATTQTVTGLARNTQQIGEIIDLINHIAGQTNLLALNATIEAAHAGEAGKGFGIVAQEVKTLAQQTAKATEAITSQIRTLQDATREVVEAIENITNTISSADEITSAIADVIREQGGATREISQTVQAMAEGTQQAAVNITNVSHTAVETRSVSKQILEAATALAELAEALRAKVGAFVEQVRTA
jgi:methyl-accepting chemotaxis protein